MRSAHRLLRVEGYDVGMVEGGDGFGLAFESTPALGRAPQLGMENLHRNLAAELGVLGYVDLAHTTLSQKGEDVVVTEPCARREGQSPISLSWKLGLSPRVVKRKAGARDRC